MLLLKFIMFTKKREKKTECGEPLGLLVNVLDYDIVESEFELQPRYYVQFRAYNVRNFG